MNYQTFEPHNELKPLVKCFWTLDVAAEAGAGKQRIVPDGCIELAFVLADKIRRHTTDNNFVVQPDAMVLGQFTEPFYIEPTGVVKTFAVRFYPYGFANFSPVSLADLANKETPIHLIFADTEALKLQQDIVNSSHVTERIDIIESFLFNQLNNAVTLDKVVEGTVNALFATRGNASITSILNKNLSQRRQLERNFRKQIGISPKQLGKVIRLQASLKLLLNAGGGNMTSIAYENDYFDQSHFIRDFKELTGTTPGEFLNDDELILSSLFYKK